MFEPIVRVLPLGLQAGNRPVVNANDRPGIGHELIVPGAAQTAYRSARQRPIWMPTVLDSGFDPAYWQLEATLSKITGTSKRQHP